ncbi:thioesterase family protein [Sneathiella chinensis]|nr:thioesterase family protein [Sneathiella chinensis]
MMHTTNLKEIHRLAVRPEWIDYNGHMNVAFYVMAFDQSLDSLLDLIGFTRTHRAETGNTVYVLETHVTYLREVKEGDPLVISLRVVDCDPKRMHLFLEMHHAEEGFLAATSEQMVLHIDASGPRAHPMADHVLARLEELKALHENDPLPPQVGGKIGIRRK